MVAALSTLAVLVHVTICVAALCVIPGGRRPSTGMAWLLLILATPYVGFLLFLLLGSTHVERRRHLKQLHVNERIQERTAAVAELHEDTPRLAYVASAARLNRHLGALPAVGGNAVDFLPDYQAAILTMADAVHAATDYVHVEFYITAWDEVTDPFFDALVQATERGVRVRLLLDHLGSRGIPTYKETVRRLDSTRIEWRPMMPIDPLHGRMRRPDLRNHRKILVVDGRVAFAGSQNLIEATYDKPKNRKAGRAWVDLAVRVEGPAVTALDAVFRTDWYSETDEVIEVSGDTLTPVLDGTGSSVGDVVCQVVPSGPGFPMENNLRLFTTLLYSAQQRISLTSPYFVPDESLLYAVTTAAQRGVSVELFVSAVGDQFMVYHAQRSYYEALLEAGVRIFRYPAPYVLHSKHFTIDDDVAVVGSSNMDMRSFALNYEVSLMLLGPEVVKRMRAVEDAYRAVSSELTHAEWSGRTRGARYVDNVMRLTAALQ
ncbi:cardiolipin synthase [Nocardioides iriomotensis]|uniref:Cardiolipin synthase n=1 Tax=Nocardioides iriomotensis TaxID=715784 RepID=A0A4Q5J638_9ACTN|nr:cardiolipin synthase [Nocardioides iriomotensis]